MKTERYTYADPTLSLWQAAVADVHRRKRSGNAPMAVAGSSAPSSNLASESELMAPVHSVGSSLKVRQVAAPEFAVPPPLAVAGDCAKTAARFLWAEMSGNQEESRRLAGELKYAECDAGGWSECLTTYLAYKAEGKTIPYSPNQNVVIDLEKKTRLGIIGDWGTGEDAAANLLRQLASFQPDILIHLGDVYYAGTPAEQRANFLDICRNVLGPGVPLFSLCGNHDVYSGGAGYEWLIQQIGQQASYFCLRNPCWQFLAMNTGHNDSNPLALSTNMTSLVKNENWSEAEWHLGKIRQAQGRRTVLLSHHPVFSPFEPVGRIDDMGYAYNPNLMADFRDVLPEIAWWFWGHEHTLAVFDPYMGLARGRCVGASAVPVFVDQQKYQADSNLETYEGLPLPRWDPAVQLGDNGTDYHHAFAIMTLDGPSATVDYYQVPLFGKASRLVSEDAGPPRLC